MPVKPPQKTLEQPRSKYLVYTSAGDHNGVAGWLKGPRGFDLWITYYGDRPGALAERADYYDARKGGKFQNLLNVYRSWPELVGRYDAVLVMDDDLVITAPAIDRLFALRERHDYWLLQPAFSPWGKISHPITVARKECERRHTNFVEMGCPLFKRDILDAFMKVYDGSLTGWGVDWWYLDALGPDLKGKVAIIDSVTCLNPHDLTKGGREIERLETNPAQLAAYRAAKAKHGIKEREQVEYERFLISPLAAAAGTFFGALERSLARATKRYYLGPRA